MNKERELQEIEQDSSEGEGVGDSDGRGCRRPVAQNP